MINNKDFLENQKQHTIKYFKDFFVNRFVFEGDEENFPLSTQRLLFSELFDHGATGVYKGQNDRRLILTLYERVLDIYTNGIKKATALPSVLLKGNYVDISELDSYVKKGKHDTKKSTYQNTAYLQFDASYNSPYDMAYFHASKISETNSVLRNNLHISKNVLTTPNDGQIDQSIMQDALSNPSAEGVINKPKMQMNNKSLTATGANGEVIAIKPDNLNSSIPDLLSVLKYYNNEAKDFLAIRYNAAFKAERNVADEVNQENSTHEQKENGIVAFIEKFIREYKAIFGVQLTYIDSAKIEESANNEEGSENEI